MNLIFANDQTSAPFQHSTPVKTRPDARELVHRGTIFIGEPGKPLGKLLELRLRVGRWLRDPIVSGGSLTNRTDGSVFVQVGDHANLTELAVDLSGLAGRERVGTPILVDAYVGGELARTFLLGYIGGVSTVRVPFWNPPTNPRQQTVLFLGNGDTENMVRVIAQDAAGVIRHSALGVLLPGQQIAVEAEELYAAVGADPVAGNKLRLTLCASAPLEVVSKVRDAGSGIMADNATLPIA